MGITITDPVTDEATGQSTSNCYGCFPQIPVYTKRIVRTHTEEVDEKTGVVTRTPVTTVTYSFSADFQIFAQGYSWKDNKRPIKRIPIRQSNITLEDTSTDVWARAYPLVKAELTKLGLAHTDDGDVVLP